MLHQREKQQVEMPAVELAEGGLGEHWNTEAFMAGSVDEPLPGEAVKRIADRRDAGVEFVRKRRGLKPVAGSVDPLPEPPPDRGIDALERAGRRHRA